MLEKNMHTPGAQVLKCMHPAEELCTQGVGCTLKPIFHQNAKSFALGTFASPNAKDSTFALPNARNTNMLVSFALGDANFLRWPCTFLFFLCICHLRRVANANPICSGI